MSDTPEPTEQPTQPVSLTVPITAPQQDGAEQVTISPKLGTYTIEKKLGQPTSSVFLAADEEGALVALKVLPGAVIERTPTAAKRFLREARATTGLKHPNVVSCLDAGEDLGNYFMAMEYFPGRPLEDVLEATGGQLTEVQAIEIAIQVARGLSHLHANGLVHRNLKPEHLLMSADKEIKLVGLGFVRKGSSNDQQLTAKGRIVGTPQYMSPEQTQGLDLDVRSDLWSLGVCLYRMLSGAVPFDDSALARVLMKISRDAHVPLNVRAPSVSPALSAVVDKLLAKKPDERYHNPETLIADLEAVRDGGLIEGLPPSLAARQAAREGEDAAQPAAGPSAGLIKALIGVVLVLVVLVIALLVALAQKL